MIGETGERKSAVATPDGKSRKKKKKKNVGLVSCMHKTNYFILNAFNFTKHRSEFDKASYGCYQRWVEIRRSRLRLVDQRCPSCGKQNERVSEFV